MTKLEQVAESQAKFDGRSLAGLSRAERGRYMERARLAIEAMREPAEGMLRAADAVILTDAEFYAGPYEMARHEYRAMINAALKEPTC